jgi:hypothetical protein
MLEKHNTTSHFTPKQGILPMFPSDLLPITDKRENFQSNFQSVRSTGTYGLEITLEVFSLG